MNKEWTKDNTETLRRLTERMRDEGGRIKWKQLLDTPEGRQLLKGRNAKAVMNQYTWRLSKHSRPAPTPAPAPVASSNGLSWIPEEEAELARLVNKYTYGNGVGWKRMQREEPEALARLTANRPFSALQQKYKDGPHPLRKTHKKKREEEPVQQEQEPAPLPNFCYNCGAPQTPINKGLAVYHNLKRR